MIIIKKKDNVIDEIGINFQECLMKIISYNNFKDIIVEFQDKYKAKVHTTYQHFKDGSVKNPYYPSVYNVGITGCRYPVRIGNKVSKEYMAWKRILERCYDEKYKIKEPTYNDVTCCDEWLLYENFYEWLHSQPNFDKWLNESRWAIDKDILVKGNKVYSPDVCCLVPQRVNSLFVKNDATRGLLPIGINIVGDKYEVRCGNYLNNSRYYFGLCDTIMGAFQRYKKHKENIIKQAAKEEYNAGNITEECYQAMLNYEVEIND